MESENLELVLGRARVHVAGRVDRLDLEPVLSLVQMLELARRSRI
jgi:hypothetical protein